MAQYIHYICKKRLAEGDSEVSEMNYNEEVADNFSQILEKGTVSLLTFQNGLVHNPSTGVTVLLANSGVSVALNVF